MKLPIRALVLSYSPIVRDPRVLRQLDWLTSLSKQKPKLSVFGLEDYSNFPYGRYTKLKLRSPLFRIVSYIFFPYRLRQKIALESFIKSGELSNIETGKYEIIILNDLDFVGLDDIFVAAAKSDTRIYVDLHEYFYDLGGSVFFRVINGRYYSWLLRRLENRSISGIFTVADLIADLYGKRLKVRPITILNIPQATGTLPPSKCLPLGSQGLNIVYHGIGGKGRGLVRIITAMRHVNPKVELNLVLVASKQLKAVYRCLAKILAPDASIVFREPVPFSQIIEMLSTFDAGIIFFHPPHSTNLRLALPNKFFEYISAGLPVFSGPSPSIQPLIEKFNIGWVVKSWSAKELANTLNAVSTKALVVKKKNLILTSSKLSASAQKQEFLRAIGY